ncbi:MAG TPA: glutaredoxin family protein [Polyangiaceae bacterium]
MSNYRKASALACLVCALVWCGVATTGCRGNPNRSSDGDVNTKQLPQLSLRDDTPDLMLTWIDTSGDFHVVSAIDQVPPDARERVRVVVTSKQAGTGESIYVADLRQKSADGTYPTSVMARPMWEETGAARRKARIEALAPVASDSAPLASAATPEDRVVVVYGAEWCGACREAERYLKSKGIKVLEKDVDQSPSVQAELRGKLTKAGMPPTSSIPVIDIGGKLIVGFNQGAVDAALKAIRR